MIRVLLYLWCDANVALAIKLKHLYDGQPNGIPVDSTSLREPKGHSHDEMKQTQTNPKSPLVLEEPEVSPAFEEPKKKTNVGGPFDPDLDLNGWPPEFPLYLPPSRNLPLIPNQQPFWTSPPPTAFLPNRQPYWTPPPIPLLPNRQPYWTPQPIPLLPDRQPFWTPQPIPLLPDRQPSWGPPQPSPFLPNRRPTWGTPLGPVRGGPTTTAKPTAPGKPQNNSNNPFIPFPPNMPENPWINRPPPQTAPCVNPRGCTGSKLQPVLHVRSLLQYGSARARQLTPELPMKATAYRNDKLPAQHQIMFMELLGQTAMSPPLSDPYVAWIHIPRTGATFGITLAYHANPNLSLTAKATVECEKEFLPMSEQSESEDDMSVAVSALQGFFSEVNETTATGLVGHELKLRTAHTPIGSNLYTHFEGHFCGMFREPTARLRSAWYTFAPKSDPLKYAKKTLGVATKMLAGQADGTECTKLSTSCNMDIVPNTELALQRLKGFKFVGLTEQWALSVCLFHTMFGGQCLPREFFNLQPGNYPLGEVRDAFANHVDPYDGPLYTRAKEIFWMNVENYQLTLETCQQKVCPGASYEMAADTNFPRL